MSENRRPQGVIFWVTL